MKNKTKNKQQTNLPQTMDTYLNPDSQSPARNVRRTQQISSLHQEFEDLKKKIKQVENKNEKIIQKIHKAFNFKKKGVYTQQHIPIVGPQEHIVYYQKNYLENSAVGSISNHPSEIDGKSNKSDQSQYQFRMTKQAPRQGTRKTEARKSQGKGNFNLSVQYGKKSQSIRPTEKDLSQQASIRGQIPNQGIPKNRVTLRSYQQPQQQYSMPQAFPSDYKKIAHLQQSLLFEKDRVMVLTAQIQQKNNQICSLEALRENFRGYSRSTKIIVKNTFQNFIQNTITMSMLQMERSIKRNQNKLINLLTMLEDYKDERSTIKKLQNLKVAKRQSWHSQQRDRVNRDKVVQREKSQNKTKQLSKSRSKCDNSIIAAKKNKQFQQIVNKYEDIIKNKNQEIQKLDKKYKNKQKQTFQLKMKIQSMQQRLIEQQNKNIQLKQFSKSMTIQSGKQNKFYSVKGNKINVDTPISALQRMDTQQNDINLLDSQSKGKQHQLQKKINDLQQIINQKNQKINQLENNIISLQDKNKILHQQYKQNISKNKQYKNKLQQQLEIKIKNLQKQINNKNQQYLQIQNNYSEIQKKYLQKQCQLYGLGSKIKKCQHIIQMKDKKIQQLEKLLTINDEGMESLANSTVIDLGDNLQNNLKKAKEQNQRLQQQLQQKRNQIFNIVKQKDFSNAKVKQLQEKIKQLKKQNQNISQQVESLRSLAKQFNQHPSSSNLDQEQQDQKTQLEEQLNQITQKYNNLSKTNQNLKNQNLQYNSKIMKITSQLQFLKNNVQEKDKLQIKYRLQIQQSTKKIHQLQKQLSQKQVQFENQRKDNQQRRKQIQKQWQQFQQSINLQNQQDNIYGINKSQKSSVINFKSNYNRINTQNQYLTQKLKQAQSLLQMQQMMQQKIITQYKNNVEKVKNQLKQKNNQLEKVNIQLDKTKKKLNMYQSKQKQRQTNKQKIFNMKNFPGLEKQQQQQDDDNNWMNNKYQQLENQLRQAKDINNKLTQMSNQLFQQIKIKQQQKNDLAKILQQKIIRIQQLEDIFQMKQGHFGSMISQSNKSRVRQSMKSQSSLRYSAASHLRNDKTMQLDLSQAGSQFFEHSNIQNISQIFQKQQFPYQKMKLKRKQQIKLFQKTASYIKTLKQAIDQKNKKIRILEKKIQSLRTSQLIRKDLGGLDLIHHHQKVQSDQDYDSEDFKDYQSVQLEYKRSGNHRRYKILEHDTKLVIEQNNMLTHQIESLQEELLKSQEQENSLVKIKDLYKQEIKKLMNKLTQQAKTFQQELQREKVKLEQSQSIHNFETMKQLFVKIILTVGSMEQEKGRKKDQKKKQLQQFVKIMSSILRIDNNTKDKILAGLRT